MAEVDGIVVKEVTGVPGMIVGYCALTGATSTIASTTHGFGSLASVNISVRGTNSATYTVSSATITITGTEDDIVDFQIFGYK